MTTFFMDYNPYTKTYVFERNGKPISKASRLMGKSGQRLQALLSSTDDNWEGLAKEISKLCNDTKINVVFRGRRIDFDDLEYCLKDSKEADFSLELQETSNDNDVIGQLDLLFDEIKKSGIPEFGEKDENNKNIFDAYEEVKNNIFDINVIATMSSGKSTLINAMLNTELLPAKNEACTATIARILDNDDMAGQGYRARCCAKDGTVIYPWKEVTSEDLKNYNEDTKVTYIDLEGEIPAIPSDRIKLRLCDTPGPNNSRNDNHGRLTNGIIRETNAMVLYVMNATNFAVNDDKNLLLNISAEMKRAGKESRDRFIFVINKCDELDEEKGETLEKLLVNVRDYLKKFGIFDPMLIPTSARLALLIRKERNQETLTRKEKTELLMVNDFVENDLLHYENYANLTPSARQRLKSKTEEYHKDEDTWDLEAVIHTGVGALEEVIAEYLEKYAYPMKISDAIQDIMGILKHIDMTTSFNKRIAKDEAERDKVLEQILVARQQKEEGQKIVQDYMKRIESFGIDFDQRDEWQYKAERTLSDILLKYNDTEKVDKADADRVINGFIEKLQEYQKNCENDLVCFLDLKIYAAGTQMLYDYKAIVKEIFDRIEISGYDFKLNRSLQKIRVDNLETIKRENETDRMRKETRWKPNPERRGFLGKFKFWKPKEVSYTVEVKDGVDVNVRHVFADIMAPFKRKMSDNIESMFEQAQDQLSEYKINFRENINTVNTEIDRILDEMEKNIRNYEQLKETVEAEKEKAAFAEEKTRQLENVIKF